jgi:hypothetical protein
VELPVADYISKQAIQLGKRLGKNTLIVPIDGHEEEFWLDARELIRTITDKIGKRLELDDIRVYLLISGCNPRTLLEEDHPFLLCDVTELSSTEFVGFFSKLLDLFNVELENKLPIFGDKEELRPSPGKVLLSSSSYEENEGYYIDEALRVLSEIAFVLDRTGINFYGFRWPVEEAFKSSLDIIHNSPELREKLMRVRGRFKDLKESQGPYTGGKDTAVTGKSASYQAFIQEVVMGDKYVTGQAGAVGPGSHAHDMTFNQAWSQLEDSIDLPRLAEELALLQRAMKQEASRPEHETAIEAVAAAEQAATEGNGPKTIERLKSGGKWALDIAVKIGTGLATAAIKSAIGL